MNASDERPDDFRERIVVEPKILVDKPVLRGTRIPVSKILTLVAHRFSVNQTIEDYPAVTREDLRAAILYAGARLDREEVYALSGQP